MRKKNGNAGTAGNYGKYSNRGSGFAQFYPTESRCGAERYHDGVQGRCPKGSESKELYQTAEENLQSAIEALLSPILKNAGYTMQWDI